MRAAFHVGSVCAPLGLRRHGQAPSVLLILMMLGMLSIAGFASKARAADESLALPPAEEPSSAQLEETDESPSAPGSAGLPKAPVVEPGHGATATKEGESPAGAEPATTPQGDSAKQAAPSLGALVSGKAPTESTSSLAGLIWFGVVFLVLVCVIYLFL